MTPIDAARFWLSQGVATVPLLYRSKWPSGSALIRSGLWQIKEGKIKGHWTPLKTRLPSEAMIKLWFEDGKPYNLALVTGWMNLVVIEFDVPEKFSAWYVWHLIHNPAILNTYRVLSNRGIHYYFYLSEPCKLDTLQGSLFEIKGSGRLCTTPPSVHESGRAYTPLDNPENIRVVKPEEILNYSPVTFAPRPLLPTRSKYAPAEVFTDNPIEAIKSGVSLLSFFPAAQKIDERFYRCDCPFHGHKSNFWIDTQLNICGCYAFCVPVMNVVQFFSRLNDCDIKQSIKELSYLV